MRLVNKELTKMNLKKLTFSLLTIGMSLSPLTLQASEHPNLILTESGVERMRENVGQVPLFDKSLASVKQQVDAEIAMGIDLSLIHI